MWPHAILICPHFLCSCRLKALKYKQVTWQKITVASVIPVQNIAMPLTTVLSISIRQFSCMNCMHYCTYCVSSYPYKSKP